MNQTIKYAKLRAESMRRGLDFTYEVRTPRHRISGVRWVTQRAGVVNVKKYKSL